MSEDDANPAVACTLTDREEANRPKRLWSALAEKYAGSVERESGYTYSFEGVDDTVEQLATFVANERVCCSFADYAIEISPPYDETRLTVTGPKGTKELFDEGFVDTLRGERR